MLEQKRSTAMGLMLGMLLVGSTAVQANAQATQDTAKASQDTSAYSGMQRPDTGVPADTSAVADTSAAKVGTDTTGQSNMHKDSAWTDTSTAGKKAWKHKIKKSADTTSAK